MSNVHKDHAKRGRSIGHAPALSGGGHPRPKARQPKDSKAIGAHGSPVAVRSGFHTVSMGQARQRDHSPALEIR